MLAVRRCPNLEFKIDGFFFKFESTGTNRLNAVWFDLIGGAVIAQITFLKTLTRAMFKVKPEPEPPP